MSKMASRNHNSKKTIEEQKLAALSRPEALRLHHETTLTALSSTRQKRMARSAHVNSRRQNDFPVPRAMHSL